MGEFLLRYESPMVRAVVEDNKRLRGLIREVGPGQNKERKDKWDSCPWCGASFHDATSRCAAFNKDGTVK